MPTYEYKCAACGFEFEKFQSITASAIKKCPHCGKNRVKRLIGTGAGLIFKGGGFYETDYRSEAYKSAAKADAGASSGSKESTTTAGAPTDSKSKPAADAKPAAKPKAESKPAASSSKTDKSPK